MLGLKIQFLKAIRKANKSSGDITADDMKSLDELGIEEKGISDLTGLEYAVNLKAYTFEKQSYAIYPL